MAHEWYTSRSKNILGLINEFTGFEFDTDHSGRCKVSKVKLTGKIFSDDEAATNYVTSNSYWGDSAYLAAYTTKKLSKAYQSAYENFVTKYNEYLKFKDDLTIAYGRHSIRVTCPNCDSSIHLRYAKNFRACPVCGSTKIISDSNWKALETKRRMSVKAAENLKKEAEKNDVTFVCGIEWHC